MAGPEPREDRVPPPAARIAGVVVGITLLALSLAKYPGYLPPAVVRHPWTTVGCLAAALAVAFVPACARLRALLNRVLFESSPRAFHLALFLTAVALYGAVNQSVFKGIPRISDEVTYLFQARIFARGHLTLPLPPCPEFFELIWVLGADAQLGHWCSIYSPGWPLLLVPGVLGRAPWIVNPLLGGLLVVVIALFGADLFGKRAGRFAGLVALFSPLQTIISSSHLAHTSTALFLLLCAWSVWRMLRTGRTVFGLLAGAAWGMALLCRPVTAVAMGLGIGLMPLFSWRATLAAWRGVLAAAVMALLAVALLAGWNYETTGNPRTMGHQVAMGDEARLGFIPFEDGRHQHTPARGWRLTLQRLRLLSDRLIGWPVPAFLVVMLPFLAGRARGADLWLLAVWLALVATYFLYWYWEAELPTRYISEAMPMLFILAGRACDLLSGFSRDRARPGPLARAGSALVASGFLASALVAQPFELHKFGPNYIDVEDALPRVMRDHNVHHAVVFMRAHGQAGEREYVDNTASFYETGFMRNDLDMKGDVIYARDLGERRNRALMERYPGRTYYSYIYLRAHRDGKLYELLPSADGSGVERKLLYAPPQ